jgi:hypothetical protein
MIRKKILFICGSLNQTTITYQISRHLKEYDLFFTPYYTDGLLHFFVRAGLLNFTILGGQAKRSTETYLTDNFCRIDYQGKSNNYDLVVTCSDLIIPNNIKSKQIILVQEGMVDPENIKYHMVKKLKLPHFFANTSMTGLSHSYQAFCVASQGFKDLFVNKGISPDIIRVTGIPNFDNVQQYCDNDFPNRDYVLAATSQLRETFKYENRKKFIQKAVAIANGKQIIFKLHPNEKKERAIREIKKYAPDSLIFPSGNTNHMIANCDTLITKYSSVVLVAQALGKKIHSDLDDAFLKDISPVQNNGRSAKNIADICRCYLN